MCDPTYPTDDCHKELCERFLWTIFALFVLTSAYSCFITGVRWRMVIQKEKKKAKINVSHMVLLFIAVCSICKCKLHIGTLRKRNDAHTRILFAQTSQHTTPTPKHYMTHNSDGDPVAVAYGCKGRCVTFWIRVFVHSGRLSVHFFCIYVLTFLL